MKPLWSAPRRLIVVIALSSMAALTACSSDAKNTTSVRAPATTTEVSTTTEHGAGTSTTSAANDTTTTTPVVPITTAPTFATTTAPPNTTVSIPGVCASNDAGLATALMTYAKNQAPTVPVKVETIKHSTIDPAWARADVVPQTSDGLDGFVAIVHCIGSQWKVVDAGTSGVGCSAPVPPAIQTELGLECQ